MTYQIFQTTGHGTRAYSKIKYTDRTKAEKRLKIVSYWFKSCTDSKFFIKELIKLFLSTNHTKKNDTN